MIDRQTEALAVGSPHHILAASSPADERTRVLKHGDMFAVLDHYRSTEQTRARESEGKDVLR